ncbi:MAG: hypothetical protein GC179_25025 [Anaerolineaceae bacterium]|nr:hypothetical protein [Anaerolineaceae bacterium]
MNAVTFERWMRRFLLIIVECLCAGTVIELYLEKHYKETNQLIPFVLCVLGFVSVLAVQIRPNRKMIWVLRIVMVAVVLGSLLGGFLHLSANIDFQVEMRPNQSAVDSFFAALMGTAPLLAPGMLGLAGVLALAATYYHPAMGKRPAETLPQTVS